MVMLALCFIIQFIIACTCLGVVSANSQYDLLSNGWNKLSTRTIQDTQRKYNCCGFSDRNYFDQKNSSNCPENAEGPCFEVVKDSVAQALQTTGITALIFSFTNVRAFQQFI